MDSKKDLLETWHQSVSIMHIAHHQSASRYAKLHRWFGCIVAAMTAIVGTSIFASLQLEKKYSFNTLNRICEHFGSHINRHTYVFEYG